MRAMSTECPEDQMIYHGVTENTEKKLKIKFSVLFSVSSVTPW
jgi:hypothetical protein